MYHNKLLKNWHRKFNDSHYFLIRIKYFWINRTLCTSIFLCVSYKIFYRYIWFLDKVMICCRSITHIYILFIKNFIFWYFNITDLRWWKDCYTTKEFTVLLYAFSIPSAKIMFKSKRKQHETCNIGCFNVKS